MILHNCLIHTQFKQAYEHASGSCPKELNSKIFMFVRETAMSCSIFRINQPDTFCQLHLFCFSRF